MNKISTKIIEILPPSKVLVDGNGASPVKTKLLTSVEADCIEMETISFKNKIYHIKHIHLDIQGSLTKMIFVVQDVFRKITPATAKENESGKETLTFFDTTPPMMRK